MLAVSIERFIVIRRPFRASRRDISVRFCLMIIAIVAVTALITSVRLFSHSTKEDKRGLFTNEA